MSASKDGRNILEIPNALRKDLLIPTGNHSSKESRSGQGDDNLFSKLNPVDVKKFEVGVTDMRGLINLGC